MNEDEIAAEIDKKYKKLLDAAKGIDTSNESTDDTIQ